MGTVPLRVWFCRNGHIAEKYDHGVPIRDGEGKLPCHVCDSDDLRVVIGWGDPEFDRLRKPVVTYKVIGITPVQHEGCGHIVDHCIFNVIELFR